MKLGFTVAKEPHTVEIERAGELVTLRVNGEPNQAQVLELAPPRVTFLYQDRVVTAYAANDGKRWWVHVDGATFTLEPTQESSDQRQTHSGRQGTGSGIIIAPMPGQVRGVLVQVGDAVQEGQPLVLLEAMKMELELSAPHAGTVTKIHVQEGQTVERDQVLGEIGDDAR